LDDKAIDNFVDDRIIRLGLYVYLELLDGTQLFSFDPVKYQLFNHTESKFYVLGVMPTDGNHKFQEYMISELMFTEVVSRHSLVVTEFDKKRAVSRISKILEMSHRFTEDFEVRFDTGHGVFEQTLNFATMVVTRDPYNKPSAF
jgi:hypothetical protein